MKLIRDALAKLEQTNTELKLIVDQVHFRKPQAAIDQMFMWTIAAALDDVLDRTISLQRELAHELEVRNN